MEAGREGASVHALAVGGLDLPLEEAVETLEGELDSRVVGHRGQAHGAHVAEGDVYAARFPELVDRDEDVGEVGRIPTPVEY